MAVSKCLRLQAGCSRMMPRYSTLLLFIFVFLASGANAKKFTIVNQCKETIWPAIITKGTGNFSGDGFKLEAGQSTVYNVSDSWSGRIWGRTGCNFNTKNDNGTCQTGSCGTSVNCTTPGSLPASIAEFTLAGDIDYYDVSLVDGFNLPIVVKPGGGKGNCSIAGCDGDLRQNCSSDLTVKNDKGKVIGCRSACDAFNKDEYCCRGTYEDPVICLPTNYSKSFKQVCPAASSYAYDDRVSIITCSALDYLVAFCASRNNTCSYQDQKFVCNNTSDGFRVFSQSRKTSMLVAIPLVSILQFFI